MEVMITLPSEGHSIIPFLTTGLLHDLPKNADKVETRYTRRNLRSMIN